MNLSNLLSLGAAEDEHYASQREHPRDEHLLPVLVAPWHDGEAQAVGIVHALTRDVSPVGIGLISREPLPSGQVACGFWLEEPFFLLAEVRRQIDLGLNYRLTGLRMWRPLKSAEVDDLLPLAEALRPREPAAV